MRSTLMLSLVLSTALLALGSVTDLGLALAAFSCVAWAAYVAYLRSSAPRGLSARLASAALWGATAFSCAQLIPLPQGLLAHLSPHAAQIWSRADTLLEAKSTWHPLSVDPPATMFAAATLACTALTFEACVRYAGHRDARIRLLYAVVAAVLVLEFVAIAHRIGGVDRVYGVYVPRYPTSHGFLSPLLNPNHASAVACVAPPIILGLTANASLPVRIGGVVAVAVSGAVALLSLSRMGTLVLCLELAVMVLYLAMQRSDGAKRFARVAMGATAVIGVAAAAFVVSAERVVAEASKLDVSKMRVPLQALTLARDFWAFGVGRGAFGSAFPAYAGTLPANARYMYVENWAVQLLCDFGAIATLLFLGLLAAAAVAARRRAVSRPAYVGALVALGGLVVHDLTDFALEFAGAALLAAVLLAVVTTSGARREPRAGTGGRARLAIIATVTGIGCASLLHSSWNRRADDEQRHLVDRAAAGEVPATIAEAAQDAIRRHPADPYFFALRGMTQLSDPRSGGFLARSIELGPTISGSHVAFARWLSAFGRRPQAFAEYRAAHALDPHLDARIAADLVRMKADVEELLAMVTNAATGDAVSYALTNAKRDDDAVRVDQFVIATYPPAINARIREIGRARRSGDLMASAALATQLRALAPNDPRAWIASADAAPTEEAAEAFLAEGIGRAGRDLQLVAQLTRRRAVRLGLAAVPEDLAQYQAALEAAGEPIAAFHAFKAEVEIARHHPTAAIRYYLDAAAASPESLSYLESAATLAEQTGQTSMAQALWGRLATLRPENPRYRDKQQAIAGAKTVP